MRSLKPITHENTTLPLSSRPERTRISYHAELATSTDAPFRKERRTTFAKANEIDRKSGGAEGRDLRCAIRVPHIPRPTTTFSFVISRKPPRLFDSG